MNARIERSENGGLHADGVPRSILDNPQEYEEQFPILKRTVGFINQYQAARPKGKEALLNQMAGNVIRDPAAFGHIYTNLELIGGIRQGFNPDALEEALLQQIEASVSRRFDALKWSPTKIERLVQLGLDNKGKLATSYQRVEAALFDSPKTVHEAIDMQYNAAWAMITTENEDVRHELASILSYERDFFQPTMLSAYLFSIGKYFGDDMHIERFFAVTDAINEVAVLEEKPYSLNKSVSKRIEHRFNMDIYSNHLLSPEEQKQRIKLVETLKNKDSERFRKLYAVIHEDPIDIPEEDPGRIVGGSYKDMVKRRLERSRKMKEAPWPHNRVYNFEEPLRAYIGKYYSPKIHRAIWENEVHNGLQQGYNYVTTQPIQITDDLNLEIIGQGYDTVEQKSAVITTIYDALLQTRIDPDHQETLSKLDGAIATARTLDGLMGYMGKDFDILFSLSHRTTEEEIGRLATILQYHRPVISIDQAKKMDEQVSLTRENISRRFTRSVGKRGFEVIVADPALVQYGYESLLFKHESSNNTIQVSITIGGQDYKFALDADHRTVFTGDGDIKKFQNLQDQMWLELLVLSHLKKVMCTEEESMGKELVGGDKQNELYKRQTLRRSEYLRRLPAGQRFSQEAFQKCLRSSLPLKDLNSINRMRTSMGFGGTAEIGMWTYVSPVDKVDDPESKPVRLSFADVTKDMRTVIPLAQVSEEEIARIEQDILLELEER